jgi:hypothetical protein
VQVTLVQCSPMRIGGEAMKKSSVSEWHEQFKESRENVKDDEGGRPRSHRSYKKC